MKKVLIATLVMVASIAQADPVYLACSGVIVTNSTNKSYPDLNQKDEKDFLRFNIIVDTSDRSIVIGDSYYTAKLKYPNLFIRDSSYAFTYYRANPDTNYAYHSTSMYIDRYTGEFKYEYSSLSSNAKVNSKSIATGTCQIGVQWQSKF